MAMVSPGSVAAACTAEPKPVGTPQPISTTLSSGRSGSTLMAEFSEMTARSENVPSMHMPPKSSPPPWNRKVPSGRVPSRMVAPMSHRFDLPVEHHRQCPQTGRNEQIT